MTNWAQVVPLTDKLRALRTAATYPHPCATVQVIETHFAVVFLAGDFAYKLKKPVQVERMDFRDLATREHTCREELRLNRRLAPQLYLGVVALNRQDDGSLSISTSGTTVDWLVKMRRLPSEGMLDRALAVNSATTERIAPVARYLAEFYCRQPPVLLSGADYLARMHERVDDARKQLLAEDLRIDPIAVETIYRRQQASLIALASELQNRANDGRVVEGHGDLRPEHIFLGSDEFAPAVIDCLEFDLDLRIFDSLEELAFLGLECDRLSAAWCGQEFVRVYREVTRDEYSKSLFAFYRTQRALTRAKIAAWHVRDPDVRNLCDWRALALSYLAGVLHAA